MCARLQWSELLPSVSLSLLRSRMSKGCDCTKDLCDGSTGCLSYNKGQHLIISDTFFKSTWLFIVWLNYTDLFFYLGCMPGYSGVNCSFSCPYPSYGVECQKSCNCIRDLCDVSTGCKQTTTGNYHFCINCLLCIHATVSVLVVSMRKFVEVNVKCKILKKIYF